MRCRYSRRLYILKTQFHSPEYIDDEDLHFLENLIKFHQDYVNSSITKIEVDSSLLKDQYRPLFNDIVDRYPQFRHTDTKTELLKTLDLEYKGDERHTRGIREQIIYFLEHKKGQIFTNRRVNFFLTLSMTTSREELRSICKEMVFNMKLPKRFKTATHPNNADKRKNIIDDDVVILLENIQPRKTPIQDLETLLSPYLPMYHPPCCLDYDNARTMIINLCTRSDVAVQQSNKFRKNIEENLEEMKRSEIDSGKRKNIIKCLDEIKTAATNYKKRRTSGDYSGEKKITLKDSEEICNIGNESKENKNIVNISFDGPNLKRNYAKIFSDERVFENDSLEIKVASNVIENENSVVLDSGEEPLVIRLPNKRLDVNNNEDKYNTKYNKQINEKLLLQPTVLIECLPISVNSSAYTKMLSPTVPGSKSSRQNNHIGNSQKGNGSINDIVSKFSDRDRKSGGLSDMKGNNHKSDNVSQPSSIRAHTAAQALCDTMRLKPLGTVHASKNILTPSNLNSHYNSFSEGITHEFSKETVNYPSVSQANQIDEVIEISDDESDDDQELNDVECTPNTRDNDQMIDFLIHRCSIQPHLHPTLLKDHQMKIELNGFLLFVNISVRLSLKVSLEAGDRQIFNCIFISSITIGLDSCTHMTSRGIVIEKLTHDHLQIALARIRSTNMKVKRVTEAKGYHKVLVDSDISKLSNIALVYVDRYHSSGELVTSTLPSEVGL